MNSIFSSIQSSGSGFIQHATSSLSNYSKISLRELKIVAVALIAFAVIAQIIYLARRSFRVVGSPQQDAVQTPDAQKQNIFQHFGKDKEKEPIKSKIVVIPPLPEIDYLETFQKLDEQTAKDIDYLSNDSANCRFGDIGCPRGTRVEAPGASEKHYLHANHVILEKQHFIATQYPLPLRFPMFWQVCQEASLIVDLTNEKDLQKGLVEYYPKEDSAKEYGKLVLTCKDKKVVEGLNAHLYTYHIKENNEEKASKDLIAFDISRLHYEGWPDHQGIKEDDLDQIITLIKSYHNDPSKPVLVHCRAGVGRTGTVIVAYALKRLIEQKKVNASNLMNHLQRLILEGRKQRGESFVQNKEQFEALWKWSWRTLHRMQ